LENKNFKISVVNPRRVKAYSKSIVNTKNDKTDAKVLAQFCKERNPKQFTPQSKERRELRDLSRLMDNLVELRIMQKVRLQTFNTEAAARVVKSTIKSIENTIAETEEEIKYYYDNYPELKQEYELLNSIPSFGKRVSNVLISEIYKDEYGMYNSKKLTAFFGLEVRETESGSSVWNKPRITKFGNPRVRNMLYMAALVSIRHNLKMSDFYLRLVNKGKPKKLALIAVMRKLLVIACAILNSQNKYDENHISTLKTKKETLKISA
jgi:transposase